jgi:hypothetical protein
MISEQIQKTLRESPLARRIVGSLSTHERFLGFYGKNPGIISSGDYPLPEYTHEEVIGMLDQLRAEGLLDFTFNGCGPNVYCFQGENRILPSERCPGYMVSRFELNQDLRTAITTLLKKEFPTEGLVQEVYYLDFKAKTTDGKSAKVFDLDEITRHYAHKINCEPETLDGLRSVRNRGGYGWNNPQRFIAQQVTEGKPFVISNDRNINLFMAAIGNKIKILGLTYGIICDSTKDPTEYRSDLKLMTPTDPAKDEFLSRLIQRYDNPLGQRFTSTVNIKQVGLSSHDPKYVLEQICDNPDLAHQFRV